MFFTKTLAKLTSVTSEAYLWMNELIFIAISPTTRSKVIHTALVMSDIHSQISKAGGAQKISETIPSLCLHLHPTPSEKAVTSRKASSFPPSYPALNLLTTYSGLRKQTGNRHTKYVYHLSQSSHSRFAYLVLP